MGVNLGYAAVKLLPKKWVSSLAGKWASSRLSRPFIPIYIRKFQIDSSLAEKPLAEYKNLTEFFTRKLQSDARPIDESPQAVVSPVDGVASEFGAIKDGTLIQAKGVTYTVQSLLGSKTLAERYEGGRWITLYLSPKDYHRIHAPVEGKIAHSVYLPGTLWPVNQIGVQGVPGLFSKNERIISYLNAKAGTVAIVKVGAIIVGSIHVHYDPALGTNRRGAVRIDKPVDPPAAVSKGEELGLFKFGSTVILLFPPGMVEFRADLKSGTFVKMGECIGTLL